MGANREASAKRRHQDQCPRLHAAFLQSFGQRDRHGGGAHVAVALDGEHDFIHRHAAPGHHRFDDAHVGLVRNDEIDVIRRNAAFRQHGVARLHHAGDGALEDFRTIEIPIGIAQSDASVDVGCAHAAHAQSLARVGNAAELLAKDAFLLVRRLHHNSGAAIAEEHGDVAVLPIHERRNPLTADNDCVPHNARADHRGGGGERVEEAGARRVDIHRRGFGGANRRLHAGGRVRHLLVVAAAAIDDEVHVLRFKAGAGKRALGGHHRHLTCRHVRDAALLHAGTRDNPLVVGVEEGGEIGVGERSRRHAFAPTCDRCVCHEGHSLDFAPYR